MATRFKFGIAMALITSSGFFSDWKIMYRGDQSKCIDIPGGDYRTGNKLQLWDCNGQGGQNFGWDSDMMTIYASSSTDASFCIDTPEVEGDDNGSRLWIWDCNGHQNQQYYVPPQFGQFDIQSVLDDKFCFDLAGGTGTNGDPVQLYECNGFTSQNFLFEEGTWNIKWAQDQSKCIDVPGEDYSSGNKLWLWDCNGHDSQKFGYDTEMMTIFAAASTDASMCIDIPGGQAYNENQLWLWGCNGATQQMFWVGSGGGGGPYAKAMIV